VQDSVRERIEDFLRQRRIVAVGVSRKPLGFSRGIVRELLRRGYDVALVNPQTSEIEGRPCHARVQEVSPPPDAALVMTAPQATAQIIHDCAEAGIKRLWLIGTAATDEARAICKAHGIAPIADQCPYMFLPDTGWLHRFHRRVSRLVGKYPK